MATQYAKRSFLMVVVSSLLLFSLFTITYAASTIGTNMSTTGTFTLTVGSATAARFQNAAGTITVLVVDTANTRVGVGAAPGTTFEVQGTASASYFLTGNTIQVGGSVSSAAYSRFGTNTTTNGFLKTANDLLISGQFEVDGSASFDHKVRIQGTASASYFLTGNTIQVGGSATSAAYSRFGTNTTTAGFLKAANDLLISGQFEVDGSASFDHKVRIQGTASASYFFTGNTIQVGGGAASVAYSRFGATATTHAGTISGRTDLMVGGGFEVDGSAAFDGFALFSAGGSVSTNFEITGNQRFGINAGATTRATLEVGGTASISGIASVSGDFSAGVANTGTSSFNFDGSSAGTQGACFRIKDYDGSGYTYLRVSDGAARWSTKDCAQP